MRNLLLLLLMFITFSVKAQYGPNTLTFIGEMRYKNKKPVFHNKFDYRFNYRNNNDDTLNVVISPKEEYYPEYKGTEIIFYINRRFINDTKNNRTLYLNGIFYVPLGNKQRKIKAEMKDIPINFFAARKINDNTYKLDQPITINEPELFSLVMMINHINEQLDFASSRKGGFSNIVDNLEKYVDRYADDKKVSYETLLDFYRMLVFLEEYVPENSFFNDEAKKLEERMTTIKAQFGDTTFISRNNFQSQELYDEWINSIDVYSEYQKTFARIKDYYSRLKLILFLKAR